LDNIHEVVLKNLTKNMNSLYQHPPYLLERKLIKYIQQLDEKNSIEVLNEINALERAFLSNNQLRSLKYSIICSCTLYTRSIIEFGIDSETAFILSDYYINKIDEIINSEEIKQLEYDMIKDFINLLKTKKEYIYNSVVNKALSYINKNKEHKLTLLEIAHHVNIHPNYLSSAFKKEVGINISAYINKQKIEILKYYLSQTNVSLSEIGYTFNFSSQAHFSKYFKKQTGVPPFKYRNFFSVDN